MTDVTQPSEAEVEAAAETMRWLSDVGDSFIDVKEIARAALTAAAQVRAGAAQPDYKALITAALPFAVHDWMDAELEDDSCKLTKHSGGITVGHWRKLRAALAPLATEEYFVRVDAEPDYGPSVLGIKRGEE